MAAGPFTDDAARAARLRMIREQIIARGVEDPAVIAAVRAVPRHEFVPPEAQVHAYRDHPLPIGHAQTISQPYIVAYMTELLQARPHHRVLEVGTGSGYQTAILAEIAGEVFTVELNAQLAWRARELLTRLGYTQVRFRQGDGWRGWPEEAPFDRILVTAAPAEIPPAFVEQLRPGGRLLIPLGGSYQNLVLLTKDVRGEVRRQTLAEVRFVPLQRPPEA